MIEEKADIESKLSAPAEILPLPTEMSTKVESYMPSENREKAISLAKKYENYLNNVISKTMRTKNITDNDDKDLQQGFIYFNLDVNNMDDNTIDDILKKSKTELMKYIRDPNNRLTGSIPRNIELVGSPLVEKSEEEITNQIILLKKAYAEYYNKNKKSFSKKNKKTINVNNDSIDLLRGYIFTHKIVELSEANKILSLNKNKLKKYILETIRSDELKLKSGSGLSTSVKRANSSKKSQTKQNKKNKIKRIILGSGLRIEDPYKFLPFGHYVIPKKLLDKNYFSLRYPNRTKKQVEYFTNKLITPAFRNLILEVTINKTPLKDIKNLYDELDNDEKELFDNALSFSKITSQEGNDYYRHKNLNDKQKTEIIGRFKLLRGSVMAGNNSDEVIKELKIILLKMISNKMISQKDASDMMIYLLSL